MKSRKENKIKSQQEPIVEYKNECERVAYSDDYLDIIVPFGYIETIIEKYDARCYTVIDNLYGVLSISVTQFDNIQEDLKTIGIPVIYGPYAKRSLERSGITYFHKESIIPLTGKGVIIGIVDSGIDYNHRVFINEDGTTKIMRIWDQTLPGNPPEGFRFGSEYTNEDINQALASENPYNIVPSVDQSGHGTFLAGIAAGREVIEENFIGAAPDADLVIVKLKEAKKIIKEFYFVENVDQVYQNADIIQGIKYVIEIAKGLRRPLVISLGLGTNLGAHDGTALLEGYLVSYAKRSGYIFTVPAGNEALAAHHYKGIFMEGETFKDVEINIAEGERGIYFSIWCHSPDRVSISFTSPLGGYIERIPAKFTYTRDIELVLEKTNLSIIYQSSEPRTGEQVIFVRMINPTPGIWTVTVYGDVIVIGEFDMWLSRLGWVKEETRFLQPDPFTTVTIPGTPNNVFTIGGYDDRTDSIYKSSGRGLVWDDEMKPDIVAPSVNVYGPFPGNTFATMTGTSIASAITGGASALLLEWGVVLGNNPNINTWIARNFLMRGASRKPNLIYPNRIWGFGALDLRGTYETLKGIRI